MAEGKAMTDLQPLDPAAFRRPRGQQPTSYLYLANCGRRCGDTPESVLEALHKLAVDAQVLGMHVGDEGVSYVSFDNHSSAEKIRSAICSQQPSPNGEAVPRRWIVRFAELAETVRGPRVPSSVASTANVEVPGFVLQTDFIAASEALDLIEAIDARPWDTSIKRRVQHYGHAFDYARLNLAESPCTEILPDFCAKVVQRLVSEGWMPDGIDQLTINEYSPGVGIASHVDAHSAFEDGVAIISLGSGVVMEFRRPNLEAGGGKISVGKHHRLALPPERLEENVLQKNVWLPANSLLIMRGEARYAWQHGIAWRKTDCIDDGQAISRGRRISLTLRKARGHPCDCAWPMMCDAQNPDAHSLPCRVGLKPMQENRDCSQSQVSACQPHEREKGEEQVTSQETVVQSIVEH
mmetsp:Transcript_126889/g.201185  ORF Transcript_126889/g.201185 Transcript_126889/m.201185 type:complete len:408 (-) Transcript_126889:8-1231(-)